MARITAVDISKLCDDWCAAASPQGGVTVFGGNTKKYRLLANGVVFHDLDHEALCAAVVGLSKILLRPGFNTVIDQDHFGLWSWCGELLLSPPAELFPKDQHEIKSFYEATIHASLANCRKPPNSKEEWEAQNRIHDLQPHHAKQLLQKAHLVLAYMAFPLLEAVLKRACASYVTFDGQVVTAFTVSMPQGNSRTYAPQGQCSSLRDLLLLHHSSVATPRLRLLMDKFRDHIRLLDASKDPFDLLYSWRNQSLHGSTNFQTIGGTVLNLSLLISLFEIEQNFDQHRTKILEHCSWQAQTGHRSPGSFYPPY
jgi:hypothetical protein